MNPLDRAVVIFEPFDDVPVFHLHRMSRGEHGAVWVTNSATQCGIEKNLLRRGNLVRLDHAEKFGRLCKTCDRARRALGEDAVSS